MRATLSRAFVSVFLLGMLAQGCGGTVTEPKTGSVSGVWHGATPDGAKFFFKEWKEGLAILIVHHCDSTRSHGGAEFGEPYRWQAEAKWWDGDSGALKPGFKCDLETMDGRTATIKINNVDYDLAKGPVFRVLMDGDKAVVKQFDYDLSSVEFSDLSSCSDFIFGHPELTKTKDNEQTDLPAPE